MNEWLTVNLCLLYSFLQGKSNRKDSVYNNDSFQYWTWQARVYSAQRCYSYLYYELSEY